MVDRTTLNVSLTAELEQIVASRTASGRYQSASDVVHGGLRLLEQRESAREAALEDFRQKLTIGMEQAEQGELRDGEEVFRDLDRRLNKRAHRR